MQGTGSHTRLHSHHLSCSGYALCRGRTRGCMHYLACVQYQAFKNLQVNVSLGAFECDNELEVRIRGHGIRIGLVIHAKVS